MADYDDAPELPEEVLEELSERAATILLGAKYAIALTGAGWGCITSPLRSP